LYDFGALQQVRKIFILQYRLRNKPKSIKIIAKSSSKNIFRWIFTYLYVAFDPFLNKERGKNVKNVKNVT